MAKLKKQDVLHLAQLARVQLSDEEIVRFQDEISTILSYVEQLQEVDVSELPPTSQVTGLKNVTRPDTISALPYDKTQVMQNTPQVTKDGYIKVKRVLT